MSTNERAGEHVPEIGPAAPGPQAAPVGPGVAGLAGAIGNQAFSALVARRNGSPDPGEEGGPATLPPALGVAGALIQRQHPPAQGPPPPQGAPPAAGPPKPDQEKIDKLVARRPEAAAAKAAMNARHKAVTEFGKTTNSKVDEIQKTGDGLVEMYNQAYKDFEGVLQPAGKRAKLQSTATAIVVGAVIGVGVGVAAAGTITAAKAVGTALMLAARFVAGLASGGLSAGVKAGVTDTPGPPPPPPPENREAVMLREVLALKSEVVNILLKVEDVHAIGEIAGKAMEVIDAWSRDGSGSVPLDNLDADIDLLNEAVGATAAVDGAIAAAQAKVDAMLETATGLAKEATKEKMETEIWLLWMRGLSNEEGDLLDLKPIEDRLLARGVIGPGSRTGVDFGKYTTWMDEQEALAAARRGGAAPAPAMAPPDPGLPPAGPPPPPAAAPAPAPPAPAAKP